MTEEFGQKQNYQVIIIGGGPGGLAAGLWCDELGLDAILLEAGPEPGGQLLWTYNAIKNHLGCVAENGRELQKIFLEQLGARRFEIRTDCPVRSVEAQNKLVELQDGTTLSAAALILATGVRRRGLNLAGEERFNGHGIIESGKRDGPKVKGKRVAIVGGGDAAVENSLILAEFAEAVTLIHRRNEFRARAEFLEKAESHPKIQLLPETRVTGLIGEDSLTALELDRKGTKVVHPIDFLLLRIGVVPNSELLRGQIDLDAHGYCRIDADGQTSLRNVFAIGDVANPLGPTVSGAVGMGATAVKTILENIA